MNAERSFGFVVGGALVLLGSALVLAGSRLAGPVLWGVGALLFVLGTATPGLLGPVRRGWLASSRVLGRVNTAIFLGLVFFFVLTPLGFAFRLTGRDELARRRRRATGWVPYPERNRDRRHFEKMF